MDIKKGENYQFLVEITIKASPPFIHGHNLLYAVYILSTFYMCFHYHCYELVDTHHSV